MPAPLAHLAHAQAYLRRRPELDVRAVVRGALFPDIRHLAGLGRELTHRSGVTLGEIEVETDGWKVGWLLHNYLDDAWNEYFFQFGLKFGRAEDEMMWLALKLAEEIGLYDGIVDGVAMVAAFDGRPEAAELAVGASLEAIAAWDAFIAWKLTHAFEPVEWGEKILELGYTRAEVAVLVPLIQQVMADERWMGRMVGLHETLGYGL